MVLSKRNRTFLRRAFFEFRSFSDLLCVKSYVFPVPEHPKILKKTYRQPSNVDFNIERGANFAPKCDCGRDDRSHSR